MRCLTKEDMCLRIRQNKPIALRDALRLAPELESYQIASRQRTKLVRGTHLEERPTQQEQLTASSVTSSCTNWSKLFYNVESSHIIGEATIEIVPSNQLRVL